MSTRISAAGASTTRPTRRLEAAGTATMRRWSGAAPRSDQGSRPASRRRRPTSTTPSTAVGLETVTSTWVRVRSPWRTSQVSAPSTSYPGSSVPVNQVSRRASASAMPSPSSIASRSASDAGRPRCRRRKAVISRSNRSGPAAAAKPRSSCRALAPTTLSRPSSPASSGEASSSRRPCSCRVRLARSSRVSPCHFRDQGLWAGERPRSNQDSRAALSTGQRGDDRWVAKETKLGNRR